MVRGAARGPAAPLRCCLPRRSVPHLPGPRPRLAHSRCPAEWPGGPAVGALLASGSSAGLRAAGPSPSDLWWWGWCHWLLATERDAEVCPERCAPARRTCPRGPGPAWGPAARASVAALVPPVRGFPGRESLRPEQQLLKTVTSGVWWQRSSGLAPAWPRLTSASPAVALSTTSPQPHPGRDGSAAQRKRATAGSHTASEEGTVT